VQGAGALRQFAGKSIVGFVSGKRWKKLQKFALLGSRMACAVGAARNRLRHLAFASCAGNQSSLRDWTSQGSVSMQAFAIDAESVRDMKIPIVAKNASRRSGKLSTAGRLKSRTKFTLRMVAMFARAVERQKIFFYRLITLTTTARNTVQNYLALVENLQFIDGLSGMVFLRECRYFA
jgi:hypothetical protein